MPEPPQLGRPSARPAALRVSAKGATRGATLAVLAWAGIAALRLPNLIGVAPPYPFLLAALIGATLGGLGHSDSRPRAGARRARPVVGTLAWTVAGTVAALLVAVTTTPIAATLAPALVRRDRPAADSGATIDAVAVLSSSSTATGLVEGDGIDRLLDGLALAQHTGRPLVISVIRSRRYPATSSLADQQRFAALAGVSDRLWAVDSVHSTHDEALRMAALARARGWHRVALVTSPAHTRRACATFERAGLAVVCTPARARDATWDGPAPLRTPADRLRVMGSWLYEELGCLVYRARGWV